jgi:hypothetical protein
MEQLVMNPMLALEGQSETKKMLTYQSVQDDRA